MNTLPNETVSHILRYTTIRDVVRCSGVSKRFRAITHDSSIWRAFYADTPFLRLPGPFSIFDLERALIKSAKLVRLWARQGLQTVSSVTIPFKGGVTTDRHLIGGRWFVVCQSERRFVLYDTSVDADNSEPRVIWENAEEITAWNKHVTPSEGGRWIVYVLVLTEPPDRPVHPDKCTLLEIHVNVENGEPCETVVMDVPATNFPHDEHLLEFDGGQKYYGHSQFLWMQEMSLIFDKRTRTFYGFPEYKIARNASWSQLRNSMIVDSEYYFVVTNTHILALYYNKSGTDVQMLVQAFTVPDDPPPLENGRGTLCLSHEGAFTLGNMLALDVMVFAIAQNSIVNPTTGSITFKLLARNVKWNFSFNFRCIKLTLDRPSPNTIKHIDIEQHRVEVINEVPNFVFRFGEVCYDISDDGYGTGIFTGEHRSAENKGAAIVKFTIDATRDPCKVVMSEFSREGRWDVDQLVREMRGSTAWDGARGRLCYIKGGLDYTEDGDFVVVDLE